MKKQIFAAALTLVALGATAEINVDFETPASYKSVGIWDNWETSPFRTGKLQGNFAICNNPDQSISEITGVAPNPSEKVLGAQRSRFGSNFFGARVELPETFELTPTIKYVHVKLLKTATSGRVMLMGLGKRQERHDQLETVAQFRVFALNNIETGIWNDAVFAVKGAGGIDIHSLVLVPDCESPHNLGEDFLFYIDDIVIDNSSTPRVTNEYYPVYGSKSVAMTRTDRLTTGIYLVADRDTTSYNVDQSTSHKLYTDLTSKTFFAKPGQKLTPGLKVTIGNWMHSYCYVDWNNDGKFNTTDELVAYNCYEQKNSLGQSAQPAQQGTVGIMPSFTVPSSVEPGMYRIRFKCDWNSIDPGGNPGDEEGKNTITSNGGSVTDAMLFIYGPQVTVNDFQLNGEVLAADGTKLNAHKVPANQAFQILSSPEKGFHNGGVTLNFGYNLDGDIKNKFGNPQYLSTFIAPSLFSLDDKYTIPAEMMRGDLLINGNMVENGPAGPCDEAYFLNFPDDLKIERDDRKLNSVSIQTPEGTVAINIPAAESKNVYQNKLSIEVPVKAGETVTPSVDYTGNAMSTYWYVDLNEDGVFTPELNGDGTPAASSELLSYGFLNNRNSKGETIEKGGQVSPTVNHPFVIPAGTPEGLYRGRMKIDWNYVDPAGHYGENSNDINANGGYVLDFLFHVHGTTAQISSTHLATVNNQALPYGAERNQELLVAPTTTDGMKILSLTARAGYKLDSEVSTRYHHVYWRETELGKNAEDAFIVPAAITDRPVHLKATVEDAAGLVELELVDSTDPTYDLQGRPAAANARGLLLSKGHKIRK